MTEKTNSHKTVTICTQAFYGNRTCTFIRPEKFNEFITQSRYADGMRIIRLPDAPHIAFIYNIHGEADALLNKEKYFKEDGYVMKPLATVRELGLEIFSRVIVSRINCDGSFVDLEDEDWDLFLDRLAE